MKQTEYHVSKKGSDFATGSVQDPFFTISQAAKVAMPGDTITIHQGIYREWVKPARGGRSEDERITYRAATGEKVEVKGSEIVPDWELFQGTVWKTTISNRLFGDFNPYVEEVRGDWMVTPEDHPVHLGDVYINGKSCYEASSLDDVIKAEKRTHGMGLPQWKQGPPLLFPEDSVYQWFSQVDEDFTTIFVNSQEIDPNSVTMEINVRQCCFYPELTNLNYITLSGIEFSQAACPWTPPTAHQIGMVGVHWGKSWVFEHNIFHDAKCSALSIGKEENTGHNFNTDLERKSGYHNQIEVVFRALRHGWSRDLIGSHVISHNLFYDCGQNGIVGHLGCIFSEITHNEIYRIASKHEFYGHEIAGIKLHAPIDVVIENNYIHDCSLGCWLDWQVQGTRLTRNVFEKNATDVVLEVTHGPHLLDNNIFSGECSLANAAQGGAFVHNLFCGHFRGEAYLDRSTPYHLPHSTEVAGSVVVYGGDDRFYQNIFVASKEPPEEKHRLGTARYDGSHCSLESFLSQVAKNGHHDTEKYEKEKQPAYVCGNCYYQGATAFDQEKHNHISDFRPEMTFVREGRALFLEFSVTEELFSIPTELISSKTLGTTRFAEQRFETAEGKNIVFSQDLLRKPRSENPTVGPFEELKPGVNRLKIWEADFDVSQNN